MQRQYRTVGVVAEKLVHMLVVAEKVVRMVVVADTLVVVVVLLLRRKQSSKWFQSYLPIEYEYWPPNLQAPRRPLV